MPSPSPENIPQKEVVREIREIIRIVGPQPPAEALVSEAKYIAWQNYVNEKFKTVDYAISQKSTYSVIQGATVSATSTSPGGADTNIQYNNAGFFAGNNNFTWTNATSTLTVNGTGAITTLNIGGAAGVSATGAAGVLTLAGLSGGIDENLLFNFERDADSIVLSSGTGVGTMDFSAFNLTTTGYNRADGGFLSVGATTSFTIPSGANRLFEWIPSLAAVRAGYIFANEWDAANIGLGSAAFGIGTVANKDASFAAGDATQATGITSTAFGINSTASGQYSMAINAATLADGYTSFSGGEATRSQGQYSFAFGNNHDNSDITSFVASGKASIAMGEASLGQTLKATGDNSVAIGLNVNSMANSAFSFGRNFTNSTIDSFGIGFGQLDYLFTATAADFKDSSITTTGIATMASAEFGNANNYITYEVGNALVFHDAVSGSKTLAELAASVPGGLDTYVQYNNAGAFGGSANFIWNNGTSTMTIAGTGIITTIDIGGAAGVSATGAAGVLTLAGLSGGINENLLFNFERDVNSVVLSSGTGVGTMDFSAFNLTTTGTGTFGTLILGAGSITDSSGAISFGNENLTTTGNLTGGTIYFGSATGVSATGAAGVLTLQGLAGGGEPDENLLFNFERDVNSVVLSSGTGVGTMDFSAFNLTTTGTLGAGATTVTSLNAGSGVITTTGQIAYDDAITTGFHKGTYVFAPATTVSGAHGVNPATLNVVSTTGYPTSGYLLVASAYTVSYTGTTATSFTGCNWTDWRPGTSYTPLNGGTVLQSGVFMLEDGGTASGDTYQYQDIFGIRSRSGDAIFQIRENAGQWIWQNGAMYGAEVRSLATNGNFTMSANGSGEVYIYSDSGGIYLGGSSGHSGAAQIELGQNLNAGTKYVRAYSLQASNNAQFNQMQSYSDSLLTLPIKIGLSNNDATSHVIALRIGDDPADIVNFLATGSGVGYVVNPATKKMRLFYNSTNYTDFQSGSDGTLTISGLGAGAGNITTAGTIINSGTSHHYFNATTEYINSANAGYLDLNANTGIRLNKAVDVGVNNITTTGTGTFGTIYFGSATGVTGTGAAGALTLQGKSGGIDENLLFNFERDVDSVVLSSSTGAATIDFGAFNVTSTSTGRLGMSTWTADGDVAVYKANATGLMGLQSSDSRLKKNVTPIENALDIIKQINGVTFNWKDGSDSDPKTLGVIAQNVLEVMPELTFSYLNSDGEQYYGVHYEKLGVVLVEALKEQNAIVEDQQKIIGQIKELLTPEVSESLSAMASAKGESPSLLTLKEAIVNLIKETIKSMGIIVSDGIASIKEIVAEKITGKEIIVENLLAKDIKTENISLDTIQIKDKKTGEIYCAWLESGEWKKVKGECSAMNPLPEADQPLAGNNPNLTPAPDAATPDVTIPPADTTIPPADTTIPPADTTIPPADTTTSDTTAPSTTNTTAPSDASVPEAASAPASPAAPAAAEPAPVSAPAAESAPAGE